MAASGAEPCLCFALFKCVHMQYLQYRSSIDLFPSGLLTEEFNSNQPVQLAPSCLEEVQIQPSPHPNLLLLLLSFLSPPSLFLLHHSSLYKGCVCSRSVLLR